jgi:hypothetical protein
MMIEESGFCLFWLQADFRLSGTLNGTARQASDKEHKWTV